MAPPASRYTDYARNAIVTRYPAILRAAEDGQGPEAVRQLHAIARALEANAPMVLDLHDWPIPGWETLPARVNGKRPLDAAFFDFEYWLCTATSSATSTGPSKRFSGLRLCPKRSRSRSTPTRTICPS
jgi:hypothetical protein